MGALELTSKSCLNLPQLETQEMKLICSSDDGMITSIFNPTEEYSGVENDLILGIDFGTSTVKVVVNDNDREQVFPVEFYELDGVNKYLLPTILYRTVAGEYTLDVSEDAIYDIKLQLMREPYNSQNQILATAFLALVIRLVRAWIYKTKGRIYSRAPIEWTYVLGVPSEYLKDENNDFNPVWEKILLTSIFIANSPDRVSDDCIKSALEQYDSKIETLHEERAFVLPEIAAEAGALEKNHPNNGNTENYLLVDIGSGTLDVATIHVRINNYTQTTEYCTYERSVAQLGTANCHRNRLEWLKARIENILSVETGPIRRNVFWNLRTQLVELIPSAPHFVLPFSIRDYIADAIFTFQNNETNPDYTFGLEVFKTINSMRVRYKTKHGFLSDDVANMPIIIAGGGARSEYYLDIIRNRNYQSFWSNTAYLRNPIIRQMLPIPEFDNLVDLKNDDHDRLMIAYGLATCYLEKINDEEIIRPTPLRKVAYENNFVSKDDV